MQSVIFRKESATDMLYPVTIMMAAAVLVVSISRKFGFGSILGYVLAGTIIGPWD